MRRAIFRLVNYCGAIGAVPHIAAKFLPQLPLFARCETVVRKERFLPEAFI